MKSGVKNLCALDRALRRSSGIRTSVSSTFCDRNSGLSANGAVVTTAESIRHSSTSPSRLHRRQGRKVEHRTLLLAQDLQALDVLGSRYGFDSGMAGR